MEASNFLKKIKKPKKKIIITSAIFSILLILYWLHSTGFETKITQVLNPLFNMVGFVFNQTSFILPLLWIPLVLIIFIMSIIALLLILWPYIFAGISLVALIRKTLRNKRERKKQTIKAIWTFLFTYIFILWFAMANNTINWLPGKSQAEYVLYEKCNPLAERYTPNAAKKVVGTQIVKYVEIEYDLAITIDELKKRNNAWKWVQFVWTGAKIFFMKGLF